MTSQTAAPPQGSIGQSAPGNPILSFVPMIVVVLIMYMLIIRPQQKQAKEHRKLLDGLKTNDKVLTQGGIYGVVVGLKGSVVQVRIADNVRIDVSRSAITQVIQDTPAPTLEVK